MKTPKKVLTPKELVKKKFPRAFSSHIDSFGHRGEGVYIINTVTITERCPKCHRDGWKHSYVDRDATPLGKAKNAVTAWKSAAKNLGLI